MRPALSWTWWDGTPAAPDKIVLMRFLVAALFAGSLLAQGIRITGGAAPWQVYQRKDNNQADIALSGDAERGEGRAVEARVLGRGNTPVAGLDWTGIGKVVSGQWSGVLRNVPAGGPYRLETRLAGTTATAWMEQILVGDLWVLAGQSNMEGVGDLVDVQTPHDLVHSFDQTDVWGLALEPLHRLADAADRVHWRLNKDKQPEKLTGKALEDYIGNRRKGAGLGLPFAVALAGRNGVPIGLLPCAHGGTSMDQWDPALRDKGGDSLYGAMVRRVKAAGGRVKGVLWYQGESDAGPKSGPVFLEKFERLVAAIRQDFGQPALPFYYVQIGRFINPGNEQWWNLVQEMQRKAETSIPNATMISSIDSSLDDLIHVGTGDLKRIGINLARIAVGEIQRGPRPIAARLTRDLRNVPAIKVSFATVNGRLAAEGRITGFTVHGTDGALLPIIYKTVVDPADPAAVLLYTQTPPPAGAVVHYGWGKDPSCNLRDAAGVGAPVFGPLKIEP
ncbi:MAG: sialate O-acetylesterase [Acidobacteria bacterium]|nr:sialate O-acetylesterase [Acidobacteriota bacterium]